MFHHEAAVGDTFAVLLEPCDDDDDDANNVLPNLRTVGTRQGDGSTGLCASAAEMRVYPSPSTSQRGPERLVRTHGAESKAQ